MRAVPHDSNILRGAGKVAFEFRHASWFADNESLNFMKTKNWAAVLQGVWTFVRHRNVERRSMRNSEQALVQHPNALGRATSSDTADFETYALEPLQASPSGGVR